MNRALLLLFLLFVTFLSSNAHALTYTVTAGDCGPGSLADAIDKANGNPGHDTIEFSPGITWLNLQCHTAATEPGGVLGTTFYARITDSVEIVGPVDVDPVKPGDQRIVLEGGQLWIDTLGNIRNYQAGTCPEEGYWVAVRAPGLLLIGDPGADNSAIEVSIENLHLTHFNQIAVVYESASLEITNAFLKENADATSCYHPLIMLNNGASLDVRGSDFYRNTFFRSTADWFSANVIYGGGDNDVTVSHSSFSYNQGAPTIIVNDSNLPDSNLTIVSSLFDNTHGLAFYRSDVDIVNTAYSQGLIYNPNGAPWTGILASNSTVNISGSTFSGAPWAWSLQQTHVPPAANEASMMRFYNNSTVNIDSTAVHATDLNTIQPVVPSVYVDGGTINVTDSWNTDGSLPGAATPPPDGLPINMPESPQIFTPVVGGALVDIINDNINPLINPIDGTEITLDVYGNERVDGSKRDIGAVELYDAPLLTAIPGDSAVVLVWTEPTATGSGITDYAIEYRPVGNGDWTTWPWAGDLLATKITGLTNGVQYEFRVAAITNNGQLPWSASQLATPLSPNVNVCQTGPDALILYGPDSLAGTHLYQAETTFENDGVITVSSGADVTVEAGNSISLNPGFQVFANATFSANIVTVSCP